MKIKLKVYYFYYYNTFIIINFAKGNYFNLFSAVVQDFLSFLFIVFNDFHIYFILIDLKMSDN